MNEDQPPDFIKHLKPAPLPDALRARLDDPPPRARTIRQPAGSGGRRPRLSRLKPLALPLAAAAVITLSFLRFSGENPAPSPAPPPVTVTQHQKTLLHSKRIKLFETENGCWELVEQQWKDEAAVASTQSPVVIRTSEISNTLVCCPVTFD
ncbi:MAG: hypothetical protein J0M04_01700 [Verrucomicrobia bacterium]|nr:hypothetical protein [Verrucomicrobiota bacterium]